MKFLSWQEAQDLLLYKEYDKTNELAQAASRAPCVRKEYLFADCIRESAKALTNFSEEERDRVIQGLWQKLKYAKKRAVVAAAPVQMWILD